MPDYFAFLAIFCPEIAQNGGKNFQADASRHTENLGKIPKRASSDPGGVVVGHRVGWKVKSCGKKKVKQMAMAWGEKGAESKQVDLSPDLQSKQLHFLDRKYRQMEAEKRTKTLLS